MGSRVPQGTFCRPRLIDERESKCGEAPIRKLLLRFMPSRLNSRERVSIPASGTRAEPHSRFKGEDSLS